MKSAHISFYIFFNFQLDLYRRDLDNLRTELEESEELNLKQKREINDLRNANDTLESDVSRLQKQKKRMQNELDQINHIFDTEKSEIADLQAKLKRANKVYYGRISRSNTAKQQYRGKYIISL